ncbi:UPF0676 protein C1494.01-like isoform X2 [Tachysurus fulvidraco]|nr:UPF0676 protein C1494.01-like isoform X2 [Tachysurus fulvidraco]
MTMAFVPVVDFEVYKLGTSDVTDENLQELCEEIRKAFTDVGFVFLKNTGIEQKEVDHVMDISKKFFLLPEEEKRPYSRGNYTNNGNHEWVSSERESLNPERPGDLKEAFNTTSLKADIVLNKNKEFISVPSIPGTVLINIADLMQRWTSDVFVSALHRVLLPPENDSSTRQALAFFVQPDNDAIIKCCDGSDKYPPVNSLDYLLSRFNLTYGKN